MVAGLTGIKVIETAAVLAGPLAGRMLADLGADVIRVERYIAGEERDQAPAGFNRLQGGRGIMSSVPYNNEGINCSKRSVAIDLSKEEGRAILLRMLENADVLLSNFRPRIEKKLRLERDELKKLNPKLIHANLTGYGRRGTDRDLPGYDFNTFWTRSGIMHVMTTPGMSPIPTPIGLGDRVTAVVLAYGIAMALLIRERTGIAQDIDTSLLQAAVFVNASDIGGALVTGHDRRNVERHETSNALLNSYMTGDGRWLRIGINNPERYWHKFCEAIERPDMEHRSEFATTESRIDNHLAIFHILEETFRTKTLEEWSARLTKADIPWGPISSLPEVIKDPQAGPNKFFDVVKHPVHGDIPIVSNPVNFEKSPASVKSPAPKPGQHTEEVLSEYGYTSDDISLFKRRGAIP